MYDSPEYDWILQSCLSFPNIHHLGHLCDFVNIDIKMRSTVLSTRQIEFFIVSYIHGHKYKETDSFVERVDF